MQNGGGEAAAPPGNVGPAKRTRRPSVRLHQPYYENPGRRKLQQQWRTSKIAKKPRTIKTLHSKDNKNDGASECGKGEEMEEYDLDDDVAIGNWKNFNAANRDGDFKRERVKRKSRKTKDVEIEKLSSSSGEDEQRREEEEEKELGANSLNCSFGNGDGNDKLSDDNNNVGGVKVWLNKLGLGKYGPLFEVHGVDDEVLPSLTVEDLKDMGIFEVGPRRKMYSSIRKLKKGLL